MCNYGNLFPRKKNCSGRSPLCCGCALNYSENHCSIVSKESGLPLLFLFQLLVIPDGAMAACITFSDTTLISTTTIFDKLCTVTAGGDHDSLRRKEYLL